MKDWALKHMPEGPPLYPKSMVTEQPERFFVAEIIREKIFLQYRQEVPYSIQVSISLGPSTSLSNFVQDCWHTLHDMIKNLSCIGNQSRSAYCSFELVLILS